MTFFKTSIRTALTLLAAFASASFAQSVDSDLDDMDVELHNMLVCIQVLSGPCPYRQNAMVDAMAFARDIYLLDTYGDVMPADQSLLTFQKRLFEESIFRQDLIDELSSYYVDVLKKLDHQAMGRESAVNRVQSFLMHKNLNRDMPERYRKLEGGAGLYMDMELE